MIALHVPLSLWLYLYQRTWNTSLKINHFLLWRRKITTIFGMWNTSKSVSFSITSTMKKVNFLWLKWKPEWWLSHNYSLINSAMRQNNKHSLEQLPLPSKTNFAKLFEKFLLPCSFWTLKFSEFDLYVFTFFDSSAPNRSNFYINTGVQVYAQNMFTITREAFVATSLFFMFFVQKYHLQI